MNHNSFLGKGWSFPPQFERSNEVTHMVVDEEDIRQSLIILLSTSRGERFNRQYGCNLNDFLHEEINPTTLQLMEEQIQRSVLLYEPRIELINVKFDTTHEVSGIILINLEYQIRKLNVVSNLVYPYYLENR